MISLVLWTGTLELSFDDQEKRNIWGRYCQALSLHSFGEISAADHCSFIPGDFLRVGSSSVQFSQAAGTYWAWCFLVFLKHANYSYAPECCYIS
jgi:hypothetical protein